MADEPKAVEALKVEAQAHADMTAPQWIDKLNHLIEEGKAAGLNPTQLMLGVGLKQFTGWGDRFLAAMDIGKVPVVKK